VGRSGFGKRTRYAQETQFEESREGRNSMTQNLRMADLIEEYAADLENGEDIRAGRMSVEKYQEIMAALRYAIKKLRKEE
jgi:hypothetical protein